MNVTPIGAKNDYFLILHRNVSERRESRRKVIASQNLLKSVSGAIPGAVIQFRVDEKGREKLVHASEGISRYWGFEPLGKRNDLETFSDLLFQTEKEQFLGLLRQSVEKLIPVNDEFKVRGIGGEARWVNVRIDPMKDAEGGVLWQGVILDVTEQKALKTRLEIERQRRLSNLESLLSLMQIKQMDFIESVRAVLKESNRFLFAYRSSLWLLDENRSHIVRVVCVDGDGMFSTANDKIPIGDQGVLFEEQFVFPGKSKPYSKSQKEFLKTMFSGQTGFSVLCTPLFQDGKFKGIISHKIKSPARVWDEIDREYSLALAQIVHSSLDRMNQYSIQMSLVFSEAKNRAILDALPDTLIQINRLGLCTDIRKNNRFMPSLEPKDFIGENFFSFLPVNAASSMFHLLEQSFLTGRVEKMEFVTAFENQTVHLEARIKSVSERDAVIMIRDITERKELERMVLEISRAERTRIGSDLHDGLGQELTAVSFLCSALLADQSADRGSSQLEREKQLEHIHDHVQRCIDQTRMIARGLSPFQLESRGLIEVLKSFLADLKNTFGIETLLEHPEGFEILHPFVAENLFRIIQESAHNAVKHGKAKKFNIKVTKDYDRAVLFVASDGKVWNRSVTETNGMGLKVMRYRADLIGAELDFQPLSPGGVEIVCSIPLSSLSASATQSITLSHEQ